MTIWTGLPSTLTTVSVGQHRVRRRPRGAPDGRGVDRHVGHTYRLADGGQSLVASPSDTLAQHAELASRGGGRLPRRVPPKHDLHDGGRHLRLTSEGLQRPHTRDAEQGPRAEEQTLARSSASKDARRICGRRPRSHLPRRRVTVVDRSARRLPADRPVVSPRPAPSRAPRRCRGRGAAPTHRRCRRAPARATRTRARAA